MTPRVATEVAVARPIFGWYEARQHSATTMQYSVRTRRRLRRTGDYAHEAQAATAIVERAIAAEGSGPTVVPVASSRPLLSEPLISRPVIERVSPRALATAFRR